VLLTSHRRPHARTLARRRKSRTRQPRQDHGGGKAGVHSPQIDAPGNQAELLNQQIAELQSAAAANAEQIRALASQLKDVVAALEQAGTFAAQERAATRRLAAAALAIGFAGLVLGILALLR
jgi:uncharacterized coiled-coil protein SlyX